MSCLQVLPCHLLQEAYQPWSALPLPQNSQSHLGILGTPMETAARLRGFLRAGPPGPSQQPCNSTRSPTSTLGTWLTSIMVTCMLCAMSTRWHRTPRTDTSSTWYLHSDPNKLNRQATVSHGSRPTLPCGLHVLHVTTSVCHAGMRGHRVADKETRRSGSKLAATLCK